MSNMTQLLHRLDIYVEFAVGDVWCYKHQFPGQDVIIVSDKDKEKAAGRFFIEYLKSLHYSIRYLFEDKRHDALRKLIDKMKSYGEPNINKTIEILERSGVKVQ